MISSPKLNVADSPSHMVSRLILTQWRLAVDMCSAWYLDPLIAPGYLVWVAVEDTELSISGALDNDKIGISSATP